MIDNKILIGIVLFMLTGCQQANKPREIPFDQAAQTLNVTFFVSIKTEPTGAWDFMKMGGIQVVAKKHMIKVDSKKIHSEFMVRGQMDLLH